MSIFDVVWLFFLLSSLVTNALKSAWKSGVIPAAA
jgi:hypothetical protein